MLVAVEDGRVAVPQAQSSVNDTAGPTKYLQVLMGTLQVPPVTTVYCVPCAVYLVPCHRVLLCANRYYHVL